MACAKCSASPSSGSQDTQASMPQRVSLVGPDRLGQQRGLSEASASDHGRQRHREAPRHLFEQARASQLGVQGGRRSWCSAPAARQGLVPHQPATLRRARGPVMPDYPGRRRRARGTARESSQPVRPTSAGAGIVHCPGAYESVDAGARSGDGPKRGPANARRRRRWTGRPVWWVTTISLVSTVAVPSSAVIIWTWGRWPVRRSPV